MNVKWKKNWVEDEGWDEFMGSTVTFPFNSWVVLDCGLMMMKYPN